MRNVLHKKSWRTPTMDITYKFKYLNTGKITPEESFMNVYAEEINKSEHVRTDTKRLPILLDAKYKKEYLNKVMNNQCQHLTET